MSEVIFYSWQSDLPNSTNRGLIENALHKVAKKLARDGDLQVEPTIERDILGVPGSPDIGAAIFAKIDRSDAFVCDVSFVGEAVKDSESRPTPNPNVLIELGYALKALGPERIIMVMNSAFGEPDKLTFDLRQKYAIVYTNQLDDTDRAGARRLLEVRLESALRTIFTTLDRAKPKPESPIERVIRGIEGREPGRPLLVRRYMEWLVEQLDQLLPQYAHGADNGSIFLQSLDQATPLVMTFARLAETIALANDEESARETYKRFETILARYDHRAGDAGESWNVGSHIIDYDFYKFIGHELFVTLFSFLVREECWSLVADLLEREFYLNNGLNGPQRTESFGYVCQWVAFANHVRKNRASGHGQLLIERHSEGDLAQVVPLQQFIAADLLLFLRAVTNGRRYGWHPWSTVILGQLPRYLIEAQTKQSAQRLLAPIGVEDLEGLRECLLEAQQEHRRLFGYQMRSYALEGLDVDKVGSR